MSLRGYKPKTKPALWVAMKGGSKPRTQAVKVAARWKKITRRQIRQVSNKRQREMADYRKARRAFLKEHSFCMACDTIHREEKAHRAKPSTDVHHTRGRRGRLLCYEDAWLAVCRKCHDWIGAHPIQARAMGFIAPIGQWNTPSVAFEIAAQETRLLGHQP